MLRVIKALANSQQIDHCILSGPQHSHRNADIDHLVDSNAITWLPPQPTPSTSALSAAQTVDPKRPILVTTADHALLTAEIVEAFCAGSRTGDLDVAVGLCRIELIEAAFPGIRKTVLRFKDGHYCGCNLFAFLTPEGRRVANDWRQVEKDRKNPLRVIGLLGWGSVMRYFIGQLTLDDALARLSKQLNLRIGAVRLTHPEAAIDVDSMADRILVENKLSATNS